MGPQNGMRMLIIESWKSVPGTKNRAADDPILSEREIQGNEEGNHLNLPYWGITSRILFPIKKKMGTTINISQIIEIGFKQDMEEKRVEKSGS
jgi:hypothetical protein